MRILPVLIIAGLSLFALKVWDIADREQSLGALFIAESSFAQDDPSAKPAVDPEKDAKAEAEDTPKKKEDTAETKQEKAPAQGDAAKPATEETAKEGEDAKKEPAEGDEEAEEGEESEEEKAVSNLPEFSKAEVEILRRLKQRREKLEEWEETLKLKENVLRITQTKLDQKLSELRDLKTEVEGLLEQYNEKEDAKISSLVKIYENMKPKDAARIFEELNMDVLLMVIDKMKEAKSAPILAKMSPDKSKELTVRYAEQRKLSDPQE